MIQFESEKSQNTKVVDLDVFYIFSIFRLNPTVGSKVINFLLKLVLSCHLPEDLTYNAKNAYNSSSFTWESHLHFSHLLPNISLHTHMPPLHIWKTNTALHSMKHGKEIVGYGGCYPFGLVNGIFWLPINTNPFVACKILFFWLELLVVKILPSLYYFLCMFARSLLVVEYPPSCYCLLCYYFL